MSSSFPFTMCIDPFAFTSYRLTMQFYNKLFATIDTHNTSALCSDKFLNKNRMNVVMSLISASSGLWLSANCDDCYIDSSATTQNFSRNTEEFLDSHRIYNECVQNITGNKLDESLVCTECITDYQRLNGLYDGIKISTGNKICFDLEDKVSRQRRCVIEFC